MKKNLFFSSMVFLYSIGVQAQVTQINSNNSLIFDYPLSSTKSVYVSDVDESLWVTNGTAAGTFQLSSTIKMESSLGSTAPLNGKLIFAGNTPATGTEVYITDGTIAGTLLVSDINPGATGSIPGDDVAILNGFVYFTAQRPAEGRELWRTDGTPGGTILVKDIVAGVTGSNTPGDYQLFSNGSYLLFAATTAANGTELWKSDGTSTGTNLLLDINTAAGNTASSDPEAFFALNSVVLFSATNATNGNEIWKTDGTSGGTVILKDINPGTDSSTFFELFPGFNFLIFNSFHVFNNKAYFNASDGTSSGQVWSTDGTAANTSLLKDIIPGTSIASNLVINAVNLPGKFIFPVSDGASRSELWQSNGTPAGTTLFKSFSPTSPGESPLIYVPYRVNTTTGGFEQALFQGGKFFFTAGTAAEGTELWVSDGVDGTAAHTVVVKDINPGTADGINSSDISWIYTPTHIYFPAESAANGSELWRSDGTNAGTTLVADLVTGTGGSAPSLSFFITNGKIIFEANNGDNPTLTDLYAVDGTFTQLPVKLTNFTVMLQSTDGVLQWSTSQEINSKNFTVQRSFDAINFESIGTVAAMGNTQIKQNYLFNDAGVANLGQRMVYYRLLASDLDGKSTLSPVITLRLKGTASLQVQLLNNPLIGNQIKLAISGVSQKISLTIMDMAGKKYAITQLAAINGQIALPADQLPRGTYLLVINSGSETTSLKFVK